LTKYISKNVNGQWINDCWKASVAHFSFFQWYSFEYDHQWHRKNIIWKQISKINFDFSIVNNFTDKLTDDLFDLEFLFACNNDLDCIKLYYQRYTSHTPTILIYSFEIVSFFFFRFNYCHSMWTQMILFLLSFQLRSRCEIHSSI